MRGLVLLVLLGGCFPIVDQFESEEPCLEAEVSSSGHLLISMVVPSSDYLATLYLDGWPLGQIEAKAPWAIYLVLGQAPLGIDFWSTQVVTAHYQLEPKSDDRSFLIELEVVIGHQDSVWLQQTVFIP